MIRALVSLAALSCAANVATAASVVVNVNPGTTNVTTALTGFSTTGAMMSGMRLTAFFSGGGSEIVTWGTTGVGSGGAFDSGWSLLMSGDTFSSPWTLSTTTASLDAILIDAGPGNTVFDTSFGGGEGTPGSAFGQSFFVTSGGTGLDITATYLDAVALIGFPGRRPLPAPRDRFHDSRRGLWPAARSSSSPTPTISFAGDIRPIPLPVTAGLAGAGLLVVGATGRRRAV